MAESQRMGRWERGTEFKIKWELGVVLQMEEEWLSGSGQG
jgi:hypothetical protein